MSDKHPESPQRRELILIISILLIAGIFYIGGKVLPIITNYLLVNSAIDKTIDKVNELSTEAVPNLVIEISVDGELVNSLNLASDQELTITSITGGTNHLVIQDGQAWISDATCPDKVCIHQGKISRDGEIIVCLPNLMIAQIKGAE